MPVRSTGQGVFLCLEGGDGTGKTTQLELLHQWLLRQDLPVLRCREPGGTVIGESIRQLLLNPNEQMTTTTETLLYMASRAELVATIIRPALATNHIVLCDRYLLSTYVYQGHAGGLALETLRQLGEFATGGCWPDWIGILDVPVAVATERRRLAQMAAGLTPDRIEARADDYHERVRTGFLHEAQRLGQRVRIISAEPAVAVVQQQIVDEVERVLAAFGWSSGSSGTP